MMYQCMICEKELRRDRLKEHYSSYVDLESLKLTGQERIFAMSRLNYEKRRHTEKVKDYYDRNTKLPLDHNNSEFWVKAGTKAGPSSLNQDFFNIKRKTQDSEELGTSEKQFKPDDELGGEAGDWGVADDDDRDVAGDRGLAHEKAVTVQNSLELNTREIEVAQEASLSAEIVSEASVAVASGSNIHNIVFEKPCVF